jgi:nicotinamide-nucleotide amidase
VRDALDRTGAVITTGGLGPTSDDLTKPTIAALFGRGMYLDEAHLDSLKQLWRERRYGQELPKSNYAQALIPEGARVLRNRHGTAPGIWLEDDRQRWVAMLPGVPREMRGMFGDELLPILRDRAGDARTVVRSRVLRTTSIAESALADKLGDLARGFPSMPLAYLPGPDGVDLRLTSSGLPPQEADATLRDAIAQLRERIGAFAYGEDTESLPALVLQQCRERGLQIAVAESCTGGLLGARITGVSGSSDVFRGGVIAYDNDVKRDFLGVSEADLREHGAVSEPVVRQMAAGARKAFGTAVSAAITGVAGPNGGTPEKPVGTVWIAADVNGEVTALVRRVPGDREEIRYRSSQIALDLIRRALI